MTARRASRALLAAIHRGDLSLFRRLALHHSARGDAILPKLSRAADRSFLWFGIAAVLWLSRSRFARRGALRGALSLGFTSMFVNGPIKWVARRNRPDLGDVPEVRRLRRLPKSTSFPSGHSASAFAFVTAIAIEKPVLGISLAPLAAGVAASRVYVGVHYPSDVLIGALIGAGIALGSVSLWPRVPAQPPKVERQAVSSVPVDPSGRGLGVVINPSAGDEGSPAETLGKEFPEARIVEPSEGDQLQDALEELAGEVDLLGICGGDGSINTAAQVALDQGKPLAVLPGGTLNHLARDLDIEDLPAGIEAIKTGSRVKMDVGLIDGQVFLNTASFGSYVDLVDAREKLEKKIGKWPAVVVAVARVLRESEPIEVEIDGRPAKVWMAFIGNCRYSPEGFAPTWREDLTDGQLDVRIVDGSAPWARARLIASILTGRLGTSSVYKHWSAKRFDLRSPHGPIRLARDGETFEASSDSVTIEKDPDGLTVIVPASDQTRLR